MAGLLAFYQNPTWAAEGLRPTNMPVSMTGYMATLACSEIALSAGSSARGKWLEGQAAGLSCPCSTTPSSWRARAGG